VSETRPPLTGYNHNIKHLGWEFHVQTEDSGLQSPHIITHMFHGGTILATKKLVYDPNSAPDFVKELMQAQHKAVLKELKAGRQDEKIRSILGDVGAGSGMPAPGHTPPPASASPSPAETTSPVTPAPPTAPVAASPAAMQPVPTRSGAYPPLGAVPTSPPIRPRNEVSSTTLEPLADTPVSAAASRLVQSGALEWVSKPATWEPLGAPGSPERKSLAMGMPPPPSSFLGRRATDPQFPAVGNPTPPPLPMVGGRSSLTPHNTMPAVDPHGHTTQPAMEAVRAAGVHTLQSSVSRPPSETTYSMNTRVSERIFDASERRTTAPAVPSVSIPPGSAQLPVTFPTLAELLSAWLDTGEAGGVMLDPNVDARLGQDVVLFVRVMEPPRSMDLRGRVAWRRMKGRGALRAGTGVEFLPSEKDRANRLLGRETRGADGTPQRATHPPRAHSRAAAQVTVRLTLNGGAQRRETLDDISEGGVFIRSTDLLPVGEEVKLTLKTPRSWFDSVDIRGRVTWHRPEPEGGFGLQFLFDNPAEQERVEQLVARLVAESL
jgi:Tfp pilus assembly protein PilZ